MTKIKELIAGQPIPLLRVQIMSMKPTLETENGNLRECLVEDETGQCTLTLWREQVDQYEEGDVIVIKGGWAKTYREQMNISSGKRGVISKEE